MAETKIGLTIYLLKPDQVAAFEADIKTGRDVRALAEPLDGEFIALPSAVGEPAWVGVVRGVLRDSAGLALTSQSPAGLLIVRRGQNTFVLSFGHAWQKLENRWPTSFLDDAGWWLENRKHSETVSNRDRRRSASSNGTNGQIRDSGQSQGTSAGRIKCGFDAAVKSIR